MADALARWRGRQVSITLTIDGADSVEGKLVEVDTAGVVMELPYGTTFIPYAAIQQLVVR